MAGDKHKCNKFIDVMRIGIAGTSSQATKAGLILLFVWAQQ